MIRNAPRSLAALGMTLCLAAGLFAQQQQPTIPVKAGITVTPDSVRIGDPFRISVGIRAPQGATIEFPRVTDSTSAVQSLDPVVVRTSPDTSAMEQYADYRVAAWDVGKQPIKLDYAIVRYNGAERKIALTGNFVFVKSVLPADTALRVPKPPRALYEFNAFPWWLWLLLALAIVGLLLLLWWWIRRRRKERPVVVVDPYERAMKEFERIDGLGLIEAGERGRYVSLSVEVLRDYIAARYEHANLALTSTELSRALNGLPQIPVDRLTRLLTEADLIKFARRPVSGDRAREIGREAKSIVEQEHIASQPPKAPMEKAA